MFRTPNYYMKTIDEILHAERLTPEDLADLSHEDLAQLAARFANDSISDVLLRNIFSRRAFEEWVRGYLVRFEREGKHGAVLMLDIDYFKQVNDEYGHQAGDNVLAAIADILKDATRPADLVGRYGGEEFIVWLPEVSKDEAYQAAERMRSLVETGEIGEVSSVTISIGVAHTKECGHTLSNLVAAADKLLYQAKKAGRNQVAM